MITTILSFLAKGTLFVLKSMVILCGVGAVVFVILFVLKFIVGALAKALGINGSSGGGGAVGGLLNTVNRGINGIFSGVGTVFNGVANTAGMTRDKILGNNHNYNNRNNKYNNYNNRYDYNYQGQSYDRRNRWGRRKSNFDDQSYYNDNNLYSESPISSRVGDPNDPTDQYFTTKRFYDDDGFDQFGFSKDGKHKEEVMKELLDKNKKEKSNKISDLYQDKEFSDSEVANKWIKDARFKKPSTWVYGAAGLTYAAAHGIGKALNKDVPEDWQDLGNKDSGIQKTVDITQYDIDKAEERKEYAPDGGITAEDLVNSTEIEEVQEETKDSYVEDDILGEIEKQQMKVKVPAYSEANSQSEVTANSFESPLKWDDEDGGLAILNAEPEYSNNNDDVNIDFSDEGLELTESEIKELEELGTNTDQQLQDSSEDDWLSLKELDMK